MDHSAFTRCLNSGDQTNQLVPFFPRNEVINNGLDFQMANAPQRTISNVSINPIIAPGAGQPFPGIMPHNMLNMNNFLARNPWNLLNQFGTSQQFPDALSLISSASANSVQDPPDGLNPGKCGRKIAQLMISDQDMQKSRVERQLAQIFPPLSAEGESSASGFGNRPIREGSMPNLVPYSIEFPKTPLTSPQQLYASAGNFKSISQGTSSPQHAATNAVSVETIPDNPRIGAPKNNGIEIQVSGVAIDSGENRVAEVDREEDANDDSILAKQNNHIFNSMMIDELLKRTKFSCEFEFRTASGSQFQNWTHIRDSKFLLSAVINEQGMLEIQACHTPPEQTSNNPPVGNKWAIRNTYNADSQCLTIIISGIIEYTYMSPLIGKFEQPISLFSFSLNDRKLSIKNGGNEDEEINQRCCPFSEIKFDTPATGEFHITAILSPKYLDAQSKNDNNSMGTAQIVSKNTNQKNSPTKQQNGKSVTTGNNASLRDGSRNNGNRTEHSKRSETHMAVGARQNRAEESKIATQLGINTPAPTQEKILADESSNTLRHVGILNSNQARLLPVDKSPDLQKVLENLYKGTEEIRKRMNGEIPPETSPKKIRLGADKQLINETEKLSDSEDSSDSNYSEDESSFGEFNARDYQAMSSRKNEKCGVFQSHCLEKMLMGQNLFRVNCWICGQMWHTVCLTSKNVEWSEQKKKKLRCCGERKSKDVTRAVSGQTARRWRALYRS